MHWFVISIALQLLCIVHVFRTGRNTAWIMAIAFLPMVGILAYLIVEILPGMSGDRRVRQARVTIADTIDPERRVRDTQSAVEFSDTVGNRMDHGDALLAREHRPALEQFRIAERMSPHVDKAIGIRIAEAAYGAGLAKDAIAALDRLPETAAQSERDRRDLLRGKVAEIDGRPADALALYRTIVDRVPGDEVRCRMAAILIAQGDKPGARALLQDVERRMKRMPPATVKSDAEMHDWAKRTLAGLS